VKRALTAYRLYLGLRLRSVARLFGALPVVAKMLFAAIAVAVGYGLHRSELPHEATAAGWAVGVFVAVGTGVCCIGRTELALLDAEDDAEALELALEDAEELALLLELLEADPPPQALSASTPAKARESRAGAFLYFIEGPFGSVYRCVSPPQTLIPTYVEPA